MAKPAPRPFARRRASLFPPVIGCDEVGRGALCGPVVVCAVWFEPEALPRGVLALLDDSKRIDRDERETLYARIAKVAHYRFAARSARCIDTINIRQATLAAMTQAVSRLEIDAPVRIDGIDVPHGLHGRDAQAVIKGDGKVPQIAAASILAKVLRDRLMTVLAARHKRYGWESNSGYGTATHRAAIVEHGHTCHHRRTFGDLFDLLHGGGDLPIPVRAGLVEAPCSPVLDQTGPSFDKLGTSGEGRLGGAESDGRERLVAQPPPHAQGLDGLEDIVDA